MPMFFFTVTCDLNSFFSFEDNALVYHFGIAMEYLCFVETSNLWQMLAAGDGNDDLTNTSSVQGVGIRLTARIVWIN